jgi:hypothetical protein
MFGGSVEVQTKKIYIASLRVKLDSACQEVLRWVWPSTTQNRLLFIQNHYLRACTTSGKKLLICVRNNPWETIGKVPFCSSITLIPPFNFNTQDSPESETKLLHARQYLSHLHRSHETCVIECSSSEIYTVISPKASYAWLQNPWTWLLNTFQLAYISSTTCMFRSHRQDWEGLVCSTRKWNSKSFGCM